MRFNIKCHIFWLVFFWCLVVEHTHPPCDYRHHTLKWHNALRTPEERLPSGAPEEEFGRMIFQKNIPLGAVLKFRGSCSWRWGMVMEIVMPVYIRPSLQFSLKLICTKALSKTLPNIHGASHVPAPPRAPADVADWNLVRSPREYFLKNHPAKFFLRGPWGKPLLRGTQRDCLMFLKNLREKWPKMHFCYG